MSASGAVLVVGGTSGIGRGIAEHYARADREVIVTSRDATRAAAVAQEIGGKTTGVALELGEPQTIAAALSTVTQQVGGIVLGAIEADFNTVKDFDIARAVQLATMKLVGYPEVIHVLQEQLLPDSSIVLYGGLAKERPYPGSTMISTVNDAMSGLVFTLARELAPVRVNAIHPGIVGDHPKWSTRPREVLDNIIARTPLGRLITIDEVVAATVFLLDHPSVNGINLYVDGGWMVT